MEQSAVANGESTGKRLMDKVAVITGGARGIGAATARLFVEHGAHVVIADVLDDLGTALASSINGRYIHCDVSNEADVAAAVDLAVAWRGRLDVMVNNAGIGGRGGSITSLDQDDFRRLLAVNLGGAVSGTKHAARAMMARPGQGGSIVCMSSSAALMGGLASHAYTVSKAAIVGLTKSAAVELGEKGIRVNCVSPHGVPSEMLVEAYRKLTHRNDLMAEDVYKMVGESGSAIKGRGGTLDDAAKAVLFLASDESGFITGHNLVVDGGYTGACSPGVLNAIYND